MGGVLRGLFNFREIRYFDIEGKVTGLKSKAMTSPCGKIRIPINESSDERSQIQEYLEQLPRRRHPAHRAGPRTSTRRSTRCASGVDFLDTPDTYYELIDKRMPGHGENVAELKKRKILIDGTGGGLLLQIFSENLIGPIFFEIIQRKGDEGFGEGNFKALFESIELDQMRRGVLKRASWRAPAYGATTPKPDRITRSIRSGGSTRGASTRSGVSSSASRTSCRARPATNGSTRSSG